MVKARTVAHKSVKCAELDNRHAELVVVDECSGDISTVIAHLARRPSCVHEFDAIFRVVGENGVVD